MYNFNYHRAGSVDEAVALMAKASDGRFLAGGHSLLPTMKQRLAQPTDLIDIGRIAALNGVKTESNAVVVGAATPHAEVNASAKAIPALMALAAKIGDPHVRHRGTIGGSIANSDPAADYPAALVGLGATVKTNKRTIAADDFFKGLFETALSDGEMVVSVSFPKPEAAAYMKFPQPASRFALVGVFVARTSGGVRVAVTGAGPSVFRVKAMEDALKAKFTPDAIKGITVPAKGLNSDIHGSAEYRAHLVNVMARRAVAAAA
ncbi:MAG: xanthine dehydrogenase family protein subunit M [Alphaproteobacteria bacterium]|nr:xanthine dehydrogenase family protein subunit M [Alphaproteobacteria bacterium]